MKVVYNACFGGFSLSQKAIQMGRGLSGNKVWGGLDIDRADLILVRIIEAIGGEADGPCASLMIKDVPSGALWRIDEYDGMESVMTESDYDWRIAE